MSKITNDDLTRSGTGCFIVVRLRYPYGNNGYQMVKCDNSSKREFSNKLQTLSVIMPTPTQLSSPPSTWSMSHMYTH